MEKLQRWRLVEYPCVRCGHHGCDKMEPTLEIGKWYKADEAEAAINKVAIAKHNAEIDHKAEIEKLEARIEELESENATLKAVLGWVKDYAGTLSFLGGDGTNPTTDILNEVSGRINARVSTVQKPLAVVRVPDGSVAMVIVSDPGENMVVLTDAISGATVVVIP